MLGTSTPTTNEIRYLKISSDTMPKLRRLSISILSNRFDNLESVLLHIKGIW